MFSGKLLSMEAEIDCKMQSNSRWVSTKFSVMNTYTLGAEQLGLPLDTVIAEVITALNLDAEGLGLAGTARSLSLEIEQGSARLRV